MSRLGAATDWARDVCARSLDYPKRFTNYERSFIRIVKARIDASGPDVQLSEYELTLLNDISERS